MLNVRKLITGLNRGLKAFITFVGNGVINLWHNKHAVNTCHVQEYPGLVAIVVIVCIAVGREKSKV